MKIPNISAGIVRSKIVGIAVDNNQALFPQQFAFYRRRRPKIGQFKARLPQGAIPYTCDSKDNECKCLGVEDCIEMVFSNDCGEYECDNTGCTCTWEH